jgi:hypothetical protein
MARKFTGLGILDFGALAALNGVSALTTACWFIYPSGQDTIFRGLFGNGDSTLKNGFAMRVRGTTGAAIFDLGNGVDTAFQADTGVIVNDVWNHACVVFDGSQSGNSNRLKVYINGSPAPGGYIGTIPATVGTGGHLVVNNVGVGFSNAPSTLAECSVWTTALSANEVAAVAKGMNARRIRRGSLAFYAPLFGLQLPEPELSGLSIGSTTSGNAPVRANHPPVQLFTPRPPPVFPRIADLAGTAAAALRARPALAAAAPLAGRAAGAASGAASIAAASPLASRLAIVGTALAHWRGAARSRAAGATADARAAGTPATGRPNQNPAVPRP